MFFSLPFFKFFNFFSTLALQMRTVKVMTPVRRLRMSRRTLRWKCLLP